MSVLRPEEQSTRTESVGEFRMRVTTYKLGNEFICTVDNVDPGANIVRERGASRTEVEARAIARAREKLEGTRVIA